MSSNLYLSGLAEVDYLNLANNLKPVDDWFGEVEQKQENVEDILTRVATNAGVGIGLTGDQGEARKVEINQDVMSGPVNVELLEQELLKAQDFAFWFAFSTYQSPQLEIEKDKK